MFNIPMLAAYCALIAGQVPCLSPHSQASYYYPSPAILGATQFTAVQYAPRVMLAGPSFTTR